MFDQNNNMYFVDAINNRIRFLNFTSNMVSTFAGNGDINATIDGYRTDVSLKLPTAIALHNDILYTSLFCSVYAINITTGYLSYFAGDYSNCSSIDGYRTNATFNLILYMVYYKNNLYLADFNSEKIRVINSLGLF